MAGIQSIQALPQLSSPTRSNRKSLMRHDEDIRCIISTALFFAVFIITWRTFASPFEGGLLSIIAWLSLFQLSFMGAVTTHNAIHLPVFWNKNWNRFYQVCLSLQYGGAVSIFIPGHNLSHHKYPQQARDVMRTTKVRYNWNLLNGLLFFWHVVLSGNKDDKLYFEAQARLNRPIVKQRQLEEIVVWSFTAVLILLDWRRWIWFALLPQFYAKYGILSMNFLQHDGCDMSSKFNFARNFTGQTLNYLCFNNGYHTVHHLQPGLHWSTLPQKHQELIAPHVAPSLEDSNILLYMWRSFIYPGLRLDYNGHPLLITKEENEMSDEPWFYHETEVHSNTKEYLACGIAGGNTNTPFANSQHLAEAKDIVIVSVNCRLNVFGFLGAPGADTNLGLRDQRLAVEWLRNNIAAFGGNSEKVVIAGQSSSGATVDWWLYAYKDDPIAHGLMPTSGNVFSFPMNTPRK